MSDSVWPHSRQPTRPCCPWDSPGKSTGVGCHFFLQCMKVKSESEVTQPCRTLRDPMDCSGKTEWGGHPVCWWLSLYFCFVCCLDEASCIGCYWWLGDAGSCIQVVTFVWVLTIWYTLGDAGACWAAVYGVAQSRTRLKRCSSSSSSRVSSLQQQQG